MLNAGSNDTFFTSTFVWELFLVVPIIPNRFIYIAGKIYPRDTPLRVRNLRSSILLNQIISNNLQTEFCKSEKKMNMLKDLLCNFMWLFISRVASPIHNSTQFKPLKLDGVFQTEIYHFYLRFSVKVTWPFLIQMQRRKLSEFYTLQEFSHLNSNKRMELKAPINLSTVTLKSYKHVFKRILIKNEILLSI